MNRQRQLPALRDNLLPGVPLCLRTGLKPEQNGTGIANPILKGRCNCIPCNLPKSPVGRLIGESDLSIFSSNEAGRTVIFDDIGKGSVAPQPTDLMPCLEEYQDRDDAQQADPRRDACSLYLPVRQIPRRKTQNGGKYKQNNQPTVRHGHKPLKEPVVKAVLHKSPCATLSTSIPNRTHTLGPRG